MNSKKENTKKRTNFGKNLFFFLTLNSREPFHSRKVSQLDLCFVSPSLLLLFLTETWAAFFHILYFANISTENLKTKTLVNTFGWCLRIMTVPNWNSEDNGKLFTLFSQFWMRQFSKATWQKHRKLLPIQVKSQKANF